MMNFHGNKFSKYNQVSKASVRWSGVILGINPLATAIEPTASRQQVLYTAIAAARDSESCTYLYNSTCCFNYIITE